MWVVESHVGGESGKGGIVLRETEMERSFSSLFSEEEVAAATVRDFPLSLFVCPLEPEKVQVFPPRSHLLEKNFVLDLSSNFCLFVHFYF